MGLIIIAATGLFWVGKSQAFCLFDINPDTGQCNPPPLYGCTDPAATNYNPVATEDDGSCTYPPIIIPPATTYSYPLVVNVGQLFRIEWDAAASTQLLWFATPNGHATCPSYIVNTATSGFSGSDNCIGARPGYGFVNIWARGDGRNGTGVPGPITRMISSRQITVPGNNAAFVEIDAPATMQINQTSPVSLTVANTGTMPWIAADPYPVGIGSQNPQDNTIWGLSRVYVPYDVPTGSHASPGGQVTFDFNITAPGTAGTYNFVWQMIQEGVGAEWFGYNSNFGGVPMVNLGTRTIIVSSDSTNPTVNAFGLTPATISTGGTFTATFDVSDAGGSFLDRVELWRAPYAASNCNGTTNSGCDWGTSAVDSASAAGNSNSWVVNAGNSPLTDSPPSSGQYIYGLHVYDRAGNMGTETDNGIATPVGTVSDSTAPVIIAFTIDPNPAVVGNQITATFSVTDAGGSHLRNAELYRSPYAASNCNGTNNSGCAWVFQQNNNSPPPSSDIWNNGTLTDTPPAVGSYIYDVRVYDNANNMGNLASSGIVTTEIVVNPVPDTTDPVVTAFSISPNPAIAGNQLTATFSATDAGGSHLQRAELWRAPYDAGTCNGTNNSGCVWTFQQTNSGPPSPGPDDWDNGTLTDTPPAAGTYVYGIHVFDNAGNMGTEADSGLVTPVVVVNPLNPPPNPPGIGGGSGQPGADNSVACGQIVVNWTDNSSNETGFRVYRRTVSSGYIRINSPDPLPANTTTYVDTPPTTGDVYYYIVRSLINYPPIVESADSAEDSAMNLPCSATFTNSSYSIISVNGIPYIGSTIINNGDTLTYQITLANTGPGDANIDWICVNKSNNLTNLQNLSVDGSGSSNIPPSHPDCNGTPKLIVSGPINSGINRVVRFDATITTAPQNLQELVTTSAVIRYDDDTGNNLTHLVTGPAIIVNSSKGKSPDFREVAP